MASGGGVEYKVVSGNTADAVERQLAVLGADGWRVAGVTSSPAIYAVFGFGVVVTVILHRERRAEPAPAADGGGV